MIRRSSYAASGALEEFKALQVPDVLRLGLHTQPRSGSEMVITAGAVKSSFHCIHGGKKLAGYW